MPLLASKSLSRGFVPMAYVDMLMAAARRDASALPELALVPIVPRRLKSQTPASMSLVLFLLLLLLRG